MVGCLHPFSKSTTPSAPRKKARQEATSPSPRGESRGESRAELCGQKPRNLCNEDFKNIRVERQEQDLDGLCEAKMKMKTFESDRFDLPTGERNAGQPFSWSV
eukprot:1195630-Prorocentrum_minimum.AAC.9